MRKLICLIALALAGCGRSNPEVAVATAPGSDAPPTVPTSTVPTPTTKPATAPTTPKPPVTPAADAPIDIEATKTMKLDIAATLSIALSPDGKTLGIEGKQGDKSGEYICAYYSLPTGKRIGQHIGLSSLGQMTNRGTTIFSDSSFDPDSDINEPNRDIFSRDLATDKQTLILHTKKVKGLTPMACSPDGGLIAIARGTELSFVKAPGGKPAFPPATTDKPILKLSKVFLGGTRIATLHDGGLILVWDLTTGKQTDKLDLARPKQDDEVLQIADDGRAMLARDEKGATVVWDLVAKKRCKWEKEEYRNEFAPLAGGLVYYQTRVYAKGEAQDFLAVAEMETGRIRERLLLPKDPNRIWTFARHSVDGKRIALLSADTDTVYFWDRPAAK